MYSCSTKKNTAGSRFWHAFNTRYNVYYNGETHYNEQIHELETKYEDNYSQLLFMHPAEAYANPKAPQPSANFDRTIEKMQKAIQLHSIKKRPKKKSGKLSKEEKEWLKREEYNPFLHNAWYLMAKAQYMKGDYLAAASTFHYISGHFSWMPDLVMDSRLWEVRSYCALGWLTEAENVLAYIKPDKITNKKTKELCNLAFAGFYVKSKKYREATPYLAAAAKSAKGAQKVRLNFLLGQIYSDLGDKQLAYQAFKAAGSSSGTTYRTKLNARIRQSAVFTGENVENEVKSLKRMTRYDRNKDYLDQIYYAIGNIYLSRKDTIRAIENYALAVKKSTRGGVEKGIAQLSLGELYFAQGKYADAQPCYSDGVSLVNEDYPNYKELKRRSDVLDELAVYSQNVVLQDSLLRLADMTPEEQVKVAERIIEELKKKEKEEAENAAREEYLANQSASGSGMNNNNAAAPTTFQINNDDSWYFYNTATKNAGKTAFQKAWGSRKLEDDWRRRNKTVLAQEFEDEVTDNTEELAANDTVVDEKSKQELAKADDPHYVEYYLKQIPKTDEEKQISHDVIQEGLFNMGLILKDKLEDYGSSAKEFNTLLSRYPDNVYRLEVYYNMYLMYMRMNNQAMAEKYRSMILSDFADSKYGVAMKDPRYLDNLKEMEVVQEQMYERAYNNYIANNNSAVHEAYEEMMRIYPMSKIMPKFMFIDALAYVTENNQEKFKSTLKEMLERYPETDMTSMASAMLKQAEQGRKLESGGSNVRGMLWATRLTNDSTAVTDKPLTPFKSDIDVPHVYIMVYSTDTVSANQLLYNVARHNFSHFVVKDFDLEQMTFGPLGLLVIKGFANFEELSHYKRVLDENAELVIPKQVRQVMISVDNFNLLLNEGRSFEEYFEFLEQDNEEKVEESALDEN
ncbi:MAG: tetratricopeptide repeat protein [Bacteroidales bacterium]|nr:tetratricopeptide repeat protein [Bacteroidales bacterium]